MMNNEEKILSMLETLTTTVSQMRSDINDLKKGQIKLERGQIEIKKDIKFIKITLNEFAKDISMLDNRTEILRKV